MITKELVDFIKRERTNGHNNDQIKAVLVKNGWLSSDVEEGFKNIELAATQAPPAVPKIPAVSPVAAQPAAPLQQPIVQPMQQPVQPAQPIIQPLQQAQPVAPIQQPVQPLQNIKPAAAPVQPIQPSTPVMQQPAQPIQPVQPVQPIQSAPAFNPPIINPQINPQPMPQAAAPIQPAQPIIQPVQQPVQSAQPAYMPPTVIQPKPLTPNISPAQNVGGTVGAVNTSPINSAYTTLPGGANIPLSNMPLNMIRPNLNPVGMAPGVRPQAMPQRAVVAKKSSSLVSVILFLMIFGGIAAGFYFFQDQIKTLPYVSKLFPVSAVNPVPPVAPIAIVPTPVPPAVPNPVIPPPTPSAPITTDKAAIQAPDNIVNCAGNLDCLIKSVNDNCQAATATLSYSNFPSPILVGFDQAGETKYDISGSATSCTLKSKIISSTFSVSDANRKILQGKGVTNAQIDAQLEVANKSFASSGNFISSCPSTKAIIASYLSDLKKGPMGSGNVEFALKGNVSTTTTTTTTGQKLVCTASAAETSKQ
jgi:hypothetical protein